MKDRVLSVIYLLIAVLSVYAFIAYMLQLGINSQRNISIASSDSIFFDTDIYAIAKYKIEDLVQTGVWSHTNSDGRTFEQRTSHIDAEYIGENLYKGKCSIDEALKLWHESPTHQEVLSHPYTEFVIVAKKSGDGCYIVYESIKK